MYLTKGGVTIEVFHPTDIARYKRLGYVEPKVGYPNPEVTTDGVKVAPEAAKPEEKAKPTGTSKKPQAAKPEEKAAKDA